MWAGREFSKVFGGSYDLDLFVRLLMLQDVSE